MRMMIVRLLVILLPIITVCSQEESVNQSVADVAVTQQAGEISDEIKEASGELVIDERAPVTGQAPTETEMMTVETVSETTQNQPVSSEKSVDNKLSSVMKDEPQKIDNQIQNEEDEPEGIDTVSLEDPQGNWLFKRIWWERAEDRYGKIRELVNNIWESRTNFFMQRNELDKKVLDPFYLSVGMGQGELQAILSELDEFFTQKQENQEELSDEERTLYETLAEEQESLRALKTDVESISNLDQAVDDALGTLMDQINKARQLERQAWDYFREIAHVLNDIKARDLYYMMDGAGRNIKNISFYLEKDFANHFNRLIAEAKKHTTRVLDQIKSLKEKGVDFRRQVDRLAQQEEQNQENDVEEEEIRPKPKKQGWGDWMMSLPGRAWDSITSLFG